MINNRTEKWKTDVNLLNRSNDITSALPWFLSNFLPPLPSPLSLLEPCRQLKFISDNIFQGYGLKNHVIRTIENVNDDFCRALCFMEYNCVSFNVKVTGRPGTSTICELNNSTHHANLGDLQTLENSIYHGITVVGIRIKYFCTSRDQSGSKRPRVTWVKIKYVTFDFVLRILVMNLSANIAPPVRQDLPTKATDASVVLAFVVNIVKLVGAWISILTLHFFADYDWLRNLTQHFHPIRL